MNKRKRIESDEEKNDLPESPTKKMKIDDQSEIDTLFTRGIEYFIKRMEVIIKVDIRYTGIKGKTSPFGRDCIFFEDLYQICIRYGIYSLDGNRTTCWVWQNGGVTPRYQKQGFFTRLLPRVEDWCSKNEEIGGVLFEQVDTEYLAESLRKKGYTKQKYHEANYYKLC